MKKLICLTVAVLLFNGHSPLMSETRKQEIPENKINILYSPELNQLAKSWAENFNLENPGITVKCEEIETDWLSTKMRSGDAVVLLSESDIQLVDRTNFLEFVVGREIIVPVMNLQNPLSEEILKNGISEEKLKNIFLGEKEKEWGFILPGGHQISMKLYVSENVATQKAIRQLIKNENLQVLPASYFLKTIQHDKSAIGFCRLSDIIDQQNMLFKENLAVIPIDRNGNGKLDSFENIYEDSYKLARGAWVGKYPKDLVENVFFLIDKESGNSSEMEFLRWVLNDGQKMLALNGYSELLSNERYAKLDKVSVDKLLVDVSEENYAGWKVALMTFIIALFIALIIEAFIVGIRVRKGEMNEVSDKRKEVINEKTIDLPEGLFYDKSHTWTYMEKDGLVKVGVDDFLLQITGQLTGIKMKVSGEKIKKGQVIVSLIQEGKQINIKSPVSGIIKLQNPELMTDVNIINDHPYADGWIYLVEPSNWLREIQFMFMANVFRPWLKVEISRLKDFFASLKKQPEGVKYSLVMQEGGELKYGILKEMEPEVWEEFQNKFMENA